MKKLDLDFAGWLWAVSNNKEKEYYAEYYGVYNEFTTDIGGRIVSHFLADEPRILTIAFRHLLYDWNIQLWTTFPETFKASTGYQTKMDMDICSISWLLFNALSHNLELKIIKEVVKGDYEKLWSDLNAKFLGEQKDE